MNFQDAIQNMLSGKKIIRAGWGGFYLAILPGQNYIWRIGTSSGAAPAVNATIFIPTIDDMLATDYSVKVA